MPKQFFNFKLTDLDCRLAKLQDLQGQHRRTEKKSLLSLCFDKMIFIKLNKPYYRRLKANYRVV